MQVLSIDIETYSDRNLEQEGVYKYAESAAFSLLLFGYSVDFGAVQVVDISGGESIPPEILSALTDETVLKTAFHAMFERVCLSRYLGLPSGTFLDPSQWRCTMVWAATLGLPMSLKGVGQALQLENQKMQEGKDGIKLFCIPDKNGKRQLPQDHPAEWAVFRQYNQRDVEVELQIQKRLAHAPVPDFVWEEYHLDQQINDRGIQMDMKFVQQARKMVKQSQQQLKQAIQEITGMENPNSVAQMKQWLTANGLEVDSLDKPHRNALLQTAPEPMRTVLDLKQQLSKSSLKKYDVMQRVACQDGRARGMFQFYGAGRTGRFTGRLIQLQNLPQNHMPDLEQAHELVKQGDYEAMEMLYDDIPDTLSQLLRTSFVPKEGYQFLVADFSAIEARIIAWLAGEQWRLDVFQQGGDIYCASASQMFGVPVVKHGINGHLRQKGKIAELALGYGGGAGALKSMGALEMGLQESELKPLVSAWRTANPHITALWKDIGDAALTAVRSGSRTETHGIQFACQNGFLMIRLLSGRRLSYVHPKLVQNRFGGEQIAYQSAKGDGKWVWKETYGPTLVENIIQGMARDILCHAMRQLQDTRIVAHVHDELIIEAEKTMQVEDVCRRMSTVPEWAAGLQLRADGYACKMYQKD